MDDVARKEEIKDMLYDINNNLDRLGGLFDSINDRWELANETSNELQEMKDIILETCDKYNKAYDTLLEISDMTESIVFFSEEKEDCREDIKRLALGIIKAINKEI